MYCPVCGAVKQKGDKFCRNCNYKLPNSKDILKEAIPLFGGKHKGVFCPNCRTSSFNKNFCRNCRYNLNDVLGYYKIPRSAGSFTRRSDYYLEINKNYLNIRAKLTSGSGENEERYWETFKFYYEKMSDLEITEGKPYLKFDYKEDISFIPKPLRDGKNSIKIKLHQKDAPKIQDNISNLPKNIE